MPTPLISRLSLEKENTPSNRRATEGGREGRTRVRTTFLGRVLHPQRPRFPICELE